MLQNCKLDPAVCVCEHIHVHTVIRREGEGAVLQNLILLRALILLHLSTTLADVHVWLYTAT